MRITIMIVLLSLAGQGFGAQPAASDADAVAQYNAYVVAVRAGKIEDVVKLIEPVPETSKALLTARIKQAIAIEALKKEMIAQMGPPKMEEDGWDIGGLPYDDLLKNLKGVAQGANVMVLVTKNPRTNQDGTAALMVRRNGKWIVPATMVMDLEPPDDLSVPFVEPNADDREGENQVMPTLLARRSKRCSSGYRTRSSRSRRRSERRSARR